MAALRFVEIERFTERLREARVELERALVELERLVHVVELLRRDRRGGMHVLRTLLGIFDEVGEAADDVDDLRPILLLRVELHQLREQLPIVGLLLEGLLVGLRSTGAIVELAEEHVTDLEEDLEALLPDGELEARLSDGETVLPLFLRVVDLRERAERTRVRRIEIGSFTERPDRGVDVA